MTPRFGVTFTRKPLTCSTAVSMAFASAILMALIFTIGGEGCRAGAVYRPVALMVPTTPLPLAMSFTSQRTCVLVALETVAWNCSVAFTLVTAVLGLSTIRTGGWGVGVWAAM